MENVAYSSLMGSILLGFAVGFAFKKSFKFTLLVIGIVTILLFILNSKELITINYDNASLFFDEFGQKVSDFISYLKENLQLFKAANIAAALAGFSLGLKSG